MQPQLRNNGEWMATVRIACTVGKRHLVAAVMDSGTIPKSRKALFSLVRAYIEDNGTEHVNNTEYWADFDGRDFSDAEDIVFKLAPEFWGC